MVSNSSLLLDCNHYFYAHFTFVDCQQDKHCEVYWPSARSGHAAVYDEKRGGMWIHGGFSTYYPYPTSVSVGSGLGTRTRGREHVALQPTYAFYLDDLWFYDLKSGHWEKKIICEIESSYLLTKDETISQSYLPKFDLHFHLTYQLVGNLNREPTTSWPCQETYSSCMEDLEIIFISRTLGITS